MQGEPAVMIHFVDTVMDAVYPPLYIVCKSVFFLQI